MSAWIERVTTHQAWHDVQSLGVMLDDLPVVDDEAYLGEVERLQWFRTQIEGRLTGMPEAVTPSALQGVQQALAQVISHVSTFVSSPEANRNWLTQAATTYVDNAIPAMLALPPLTGDDETAAARRSAHLLQGQSEKVLASLRESVARLQSEHASQVQAVGESLLAAKKEASDLRALISNEETRVTQQASRLDTAITTQQTAFETQQTERAAAFKKEADEREESMTDLLTSIEREAAERAEAEAAKAEGHMAFLVQKRDEATKLIEATGRRTVTAEFGQHAQTERRHAFWWSIAAVTFALGGFAFITYQIANIGDADLSWQLTLFKITASLALLAVAGYSARQGSGHRREERHAKDLQLKLNALEPLLSRLAESEQARLRAEFADRIFAARATLTSPQVTPTDAGDLNPMARAVGVAIKAFADSGSK